MRSKCGEISTLYHLRDSCVAVARATQSNRAVQNDTIRRPPREVEGGAEPSGGGGAVWRAPGGGRQSDAAQKRS